MNADCSLSSLVSVMETVAFIYGQSLSCSGRVKSGG